MARHCREGRAKTRAYNSTVRARRRPRTRHVVALHVMKRENSNLCCETTLRRAGQSSRLKPEASVQAMEIALQGHAIAASSAIAENFPRDVRKFIVPRARLGGQLAARSSFSSAGSIEQRSFRRQWPGLVDVAWARVAGRDSVCLKHGVARRARAELRPLGRGGRDDGAQLPVARAERAVGERRTRRRRPPNRRRRSGRRPRPTSSTWSRRAHHIERWPDTSSRSSHSHAMCRGFCCLSVPVVGTGAPIDVIRAWTRCDC